MRKLLFQALLFVIPFCSPASIKAQPQAITGVINAYTPVLAHNPCENKFTVEDASQFRAGDTVLMIQMKGAYIDSSNSITFGNISSYNNAGNYEFNYIRSVSGNIIELKNVLTRNYSIPDGKVQFVRVPFYSSVQVNGTINCLPWDGSKGGIIVLIASDTIYLNGSIDASAGGFRGGTGFNSQNSTLNCFQNNYNEPISNNHLAGQKGESIAVISSNIICGKGSPAGGGGGGLGHNSGGGGGGNGGTGGTGGYQLEPCGNSPFDNRGRGGHTMLYSTGANKIFLGSGGGAGQADNAGNVPPFGGRGGGIILIKANYLKANTNKILSNGAAASICTIPPSVDCHDGMGGGGSGGSILLEIGQYIDNITIENKGGKGADMIGSVPLGGRIGAGGGGGGGLLFIKNNALPASITNINTGGLNGVLTTDNNNSWGATPGANGQTIFNLVLPFDNVLFKKNIDSVRIKDSLITCSNFNFSGLAYYNSNAIASWQWDLGDGNTGNTQQLNHSYVTPGTYTVWLWVTDLNGCKDSISRIVNASLLTLDAGSGDTICITGSSTLQAIATGASNYSWSPAIYLNNPNILNPTATPPTTTTFYLTASNAQGCSLTDSVLVEVRSFGGFLINPPLSTCTGQSVQLLAGGGDIYNWSPSGSLNDATIPDPFATPGSTTPYSVNIVDTLCGFSTTLSTIVTVLPLPLVKAARSNDIDCITPQSILNASGASNYIWSPTASLNNATIASPVATPTTTTQYLVKGTDRSGCINYDSVTVKVTNLNKSGYAMATAFTPNNDGVNDCYGIKYWGTITELQFSIYNRWGQRIFYTTNPTACWDGNYQGVPQDPNVFVYMIRANTICGGIIFRKGTFALIR